MCCVMLEKFVNTVPQAQCTAMLTKLRELKPEITVVTSKRYIHRCPSSLSGALGLKCPDEGLKSSLTSSTLGDAPAETKALLHVKHIGMFFSCISQRIKRPSASITDVSVTAAAAFPSSPHILRRPTSCASYRFLANSFNLLQQYPLYSTPSNLFGIICKAGVSPTAQAAQQPKQPVRKKSSCLLAVKQCVVYARRVPALQAVAARCSTSASCFIQRTQSQFKLSAALCCHAHLACWQTLTALRKQPTLKPVTPLEAVQQVQLSTALSHHLANH
jgi:hypothetical protein